MLDFIFEKIFGIIFLPFYCVIIFPIALFDSFRTKQSMKAVYVKKIKSYLETVLIT